MTERELRKRLIETDGKGLSALEVEKLDSALAGSEFVSQTVRELPEDSVSLAWRSQLNERLFAEAGAKHHVARRSWVWRPALGLGLAGALALAVFMPGLNGGPSGTGGTSGVEAEMVVAHQEAVTSMLVAGRGLASLEAIPTAKNASNMIRWDEADLGDL